MEIINRTDEFWMEFFDPTDAYEDLYVDEKMIIYAYKNLKEVDFKSIFYEKYNTDSFLQYINSYIQKYGNLYLIKGDTYSIKLDTNEE